MKIINMHNQLCFKHISQDLPQAHELFSKQDFIGIRRLLNLSQHQPPELEDIWRMMDHVWDECGCDNQVLDWDKIGRFYAQPVWLLNGLFIEQHQLSMQHRNVTSDWIVTRDSVVSVLDYGGGFGTLAKLLADKKTELQVDIYEPHPSDFAKKRLSDYKNISFINKINGRYDVLVSTDVLEHVPDPLKIFEEMILSVKDNGYLVIANNFSPVIKCHLPQTFHFRYTFNGFAKLMGLGVVGRLEGSYATIFTKRSNKPFNWPVVRVLEKISKSLFPLIEFSKPVLRSIYKLVKHENSPS